MTGGIRSGREPFGKKVVDWFRTGLDESNGGQDLRTGPSVFKRADGRWEARYRKGRDKQNNRILYGSVYGSTREDAIRKRNEILALLYPDADSGFPTENGKLYIDPLEAFDGTVADSDLFRTAAKNRKERYFPPLKEEQEAALENLLKRADPADAFPFVLSLHAGLSVYELAVLKWSDIDRKTGRILVSRTAIPVQRRLIAVTYDSPRVIPFTDPIRSALARMPERTAGGDVNEARDDTGYGDADTDRYVFGNTSHPVTGIQSVHNAFRKLVGGGPEWKEVLPGSLRTTFVKNCLLADLNAETVSALTGIDRPQLYRSFGQWIQPKIEDISRLDHPNGNEAEKGRQLNLLILGAGSHGHSVLETAERLGVFGEIKFLDDYIRNEDVIGGFEDADHLVERFPCAFIAIGDNTIRKIWAEKLKSWGYMFPHLISPDTTVSKHVKIGEGTIVMAQATISASTIGNFVIVSPNALVSYGADVKDYVNLDSGSIVMKETVVPESTKVNSGSIYPG